MIYLITWLLLGSLSLNYLYITDSMNCNGGEIGFLTYFKGFIMGLILGPFTILTAFLIRKIGEK